MNSTLSIARTAFRVRSVLDLYYPEEAGPIDQFTGKPPSYSDINISTDIVQGGGSDFNKMEVVAEAESAWKLLDDGESRWFVSCLELSEGVPVWAAKMSARCNHIEIQFNAPVGEDLRRVPSPLLYPLDQLLMIHVLASRRGLIVHGTGIKSGDNAVLLAGVSGAGKTTLAGILSERTDLKILSDDRVVIREHEGCFRAYGTPWPGDGGYALDESGELKRICFLMQGEVNELRPLESNRVFEKIMPVASIPWYDVDLMNSSISFVETLVRVVPGCDFVFRKDESVIKQVESLFG